VQRVERWTKFTNVAERKLQLVLNKLIKWADCNGFKFSKDETCLVHFCNQRKLHPDPTLLLNNHPLLVVKEVKCHSGSAPGPTLGIEYGKAFTVTFTDG